MAKRLRHRSKAHRLQVETLEDRHLLAACVEPAQGLAILPGDIDGNGAVEFGDFLVLADSFGSEVAPYTLGDVDGDGLVGFPDFLILSDNFGRTPSLAHGLDLNTMQCKLDEAVNILQSGSSGNEPLINQAIDTIIEAVTTSNIVPLPSPDDPNTTQEDEAALTEEVHREWNNLLNQGAEELSRYFSRDTRGTADTRAAAFEAWNFLVLLREVTHEVGEHIRACGQLPGPAGYAVPQNHPCAVLQQDDEGGLNVVDTVLGGLYHRQIRSPFPLLNLSTTTSIQEQVIIPDGPLAPGEATVIAKEVQGIKAVVTARQIPIWAEPWTSRARIIGFRRVFVLEFVPAEWIKTISFVNNPITGRVDTYVDTTVVIERELLHFWRFLEKDITPVG